MKENLFDIYNVGNTSKLTTVNEREAKVSLYFERSHQHREENQGASSYFETRSLVSPEVQTGSRLRPLISFAV